MRMLLRSTANVISAFVVSQLNRFHLNLIGANDILAMNYDEDDET